MLTALPAGFGQQIKGFKNEFLDDFAGTRRQLIQLAQATPPDKFGWRPAKDVRSAGEVYMHIATGNFLLLSLTGVKLPTEFYQEAAAKDPMAIVRRNMQMEKSVTAKDQVFRILEASLDAVRDEFSKATEADLEKPADFFGEKTTVRRVYLRILAHVNEHMGQSIAYARMNGIVPPWSRPQ